MAARHVLVPVLVLAALQVLGAGGKPVAPPLDAVDTCIFTCDYCYKGQVLLKCANECLQSSGDMDKLWLNTCPYFGLPLYFD